MVTSKVARLQPRRQSLDGRRVDEAQSDGYTPRVTRPLTCTTCVAVVDRRRLMPKQPARR